MNFSHYLPNTEKRLATLKRVINSRVVAIILPGYSIYELGDRIEEFRDFDICYAGVNKWLPLEEGILSQIDKRCSIMFNGAAPDYFFDEICAYLDRADDNIYISERMNFKEDGGQNLIRLYEKYDDKLLFFTSFYSEDERPSSEYPLHLIRQNSLSILTALVSIGQPRAIIHFGADGGRISNEELYFKKINEFTHPDTLPAEITLARDTQWFNEDMLKTIERTRKTYNLKNCDIINCSPSSYLTAFPCWSYDDTIDYLRRIC